MHTNTGMVLTSWLLHDALVELAYVSLGFLQQCTCACFHIFHLLVLLAFSTLILHPFFWFAACGRLVQPLTPSAFQSLCTGDLITTALCHHVRVPKLLGQVRVLRLVLQGHGELLRVNS